MAGCCVPGDRFGAAGPPGCSVPPHLGVDSRRQAHYCCGVDVTPLARGFRLSRSDEQHAAVSFSQMAQRPVEDRHNACRIFGRKDHEARGAALDPCLAPGPRSRHSVRSSTVETVRLCCRSWCPSHIPPLSSLGYVLFFAFAGVRDSSLWSRRSSRRWRTSHCSRLWDRFSRARTFLPETRLRW